MCKDTLKDVRLRWSRFIPVAYFYKHITPLGLIDRYMLLNLFTSFRTLEGEVPEIKSIMDSYDL